MDAGEQDSVGIFGLSFDVCDVVAGEERGRLAIRVREGC